MLFRLYPKFLKISTSTSFEAVRKLSLRGACDEAIPYLSQKDCFVRPRRTRNDKKGHSRTVSVRGGSFKKFLVPLLLAVLGLGLAPLPARAALGINFDINPKEVGSGTRPALNFNVRLSGIDSAACPNPSVNKFYLAISKSEGTTPPPTDRAYLFKQIDLSQGTVTWNPVTAEDFGANTVLNFRGFAVCTAVSLSSTFIPASDVKIQSEPVSVKSKGFDPNSDKFKATLTFQPVEVQFGGTIKFTLTVKDQTSTFGNGTGELSVCDSELKNCADSFVKVNGKGRSISGSFVVDSAKGFKVGDNTIFGRMTYIEVTSVGSTTYKYDAVATLKVTKSDQKTPSVTASEKSTAGAPGGAVFKVFSITYLDGGTGKRPSSYKIDCGQGGQLKKQSLTEFECQYPLNPAKKYEGKIQALDQAGKEIVAGAFTVDITGQEDRGGAPSLNEQGTVGGLVSLVNLILGAIVAILRWIIWGLGTIIFVPLLETTLSIEASNITAPIVAGWTIVRDVVNMFFILILIVIGFGTMLRIESYNYKKLLVNLIVMALLVNFSLLIGRIIIQIADTAQFSFLSADEGVNSVKNLFVKLTTSQIPFVTKGFFQSSGSGALAVTFSIIFQFILELGVIITFAALAIFMLIRTIALYILLIISPLAYALHILPATSALAKKWWSSFIKYALFAPVIAFFLMLADMLYSSAFQILPVTKNFEAVDVKISADFSTYLSQLGATTGVIQLKDSLQLGIIYVVILAFLWAGMIVTKNMGIFGAAAIVGLAERGMKAPLAIPRLAGKGLWAGTKALANLGAEKILEKYHKEIRPKKWIEGWKESREANRLAREEAGLAGAAGKSVLANPTSFFQRYWNKKGITKAMTRANKRGQQMLEEATADDKKAAELEMQAKIFEEQGNQAEADKAGQQAKELRRQASEKAQEAKHLVHDPDYFTQRKLREATNNEKAKITGETWQELTDYSHGAIEEKHIARFRALFEKLADTYNENELITHTRYGRDQMAHESGEWQDLKTRNMVIARAIKGGMDATKAGNGDFVMHTADEFFSEDSDGIENFRKLILEEKLGMNETESMRHVADIGDIASKRGHYGIWRLYNTKNGRWQRNPKDDWDAEIRIEKGKMAPSEFTNTNRLSGHDEYVSLNYDRDGVRIALTQKNEIDETINRIDNLGFTLGRGTFDLSKARALAFAPNIARLRKEALRLDDTVAIKAVDLKRQDFRSNITYYDPNTRREITLPDNRTWTRQKEALWTLSQLEKIGLEQFKPEELKEHNRVLEELIKANKISERHRQSMREAGMTRVGSTEV